MDPQSNQTPGLRLPQPSVGSGAMPEAYTQSAPVPLPQSSYQAPAQPQIYGAPTFSAQQQAAVAMPMEQPQSSPEPMAPTSTPSPVAAAPTDGDEDQADEAWVAKAKDVARQFQADPFLESQALSKLKAEYLQTRYGKSIKVSE